MENMSNYTAKAKRNIQFFLQNLKVDLNQK